MHALPAASHLLASGAPVAFAASLAWELPLGLVVLGVIAGLWLLAGAEPRRRRVYRWASEALQRKDWALALADAHRLRSLSLSSLLWQARAGQIEGRCHELAGDEALGQQAYESALDHYNHATRLLDQDATPARARIVEEMLAEVRRLAADPAGDAAARDMATRVLAVEPGCAEALFWQGVCHAREGQAGSALAYLKAAREACAAKILDPSLYLGGLLLRQKNAKEALPYLSEASRLAPGNLFAAWGLGMAIANGGAETVALGALRRALKPDGLARWWGQPERAWVEGMPDPAHSFVARSAARHRYACPVFGDVRAMVVRGQRTLAHVQFRRGRYDKAARLYEALLQSQSPTARLLRGLGLSLSRLGRYAEAYRPLRDAHCLRPDDALTAGHLALCIVHVRKARADKRTQDVGRALRVLAPYQIQGDSEWANICAAVLAEARAAGVPVPVEEQVRLCDALASVDAADAGAAETYHALAATAPETLRPEYAWLYGRAAQLHGLRQEHELVLFARAFSNAPAAEAYYSRHGWDLGEIQFAYLERHAARRPGAFPEPLWGGEPARGEEWLLARSQRQERERRLEAARTTAEVWLALAPTSPRAHDRLAALCYGTGDLGRAAGLLAHWHTLAPDEPTPLVRLAALEASRGDAEACAAAIRQALAVVVGSSRTALAFLGGQLVLRAGVAPRLGRVGSGSPVAFTSTAAALAAVRFFEECLKGNANHEAGRMWLAAARVVAGEETALAGQAASMDRPGVSDPRFHYFAAVCHLVAGDGPRAIEAAGRAALDPALAPEAAYLLGMARLRAGDAEAAAAELRKSLAYAPAGPSARHVRALLGNLDFARGAYQEALVQWCALDASTRAAWGVDEPIRQTAFMAGLLLLRDGQLEAAAELMAQAARLGVRCQPLVDLARIKDAQRRLHGELTGSDGEEDRLRAGARLLEKVLQDGSQDRTVVLRLAAVYRRLNDPAAERRVLEQSVGPDAEVALRLGLLSLRETRLDQAEQEFSHAWEANPESYDIGFNLLRTRLSLARLDRAEEVVARVAELAPAEDDQRLFRLLHALLRACLAPEGVSRFDTSLAEMSPTDESGLLGLIRGTGDLASAEVLLETLLATRISSLPVREAHLETLLLRAKREAERGAWAVTYRLLAPALRERKIAPLLRAALLNLAGCCAYLAQGWNEAAALFAKALEAGGGDACIHQNLALTDERRGVLDSADQHWNGYLDRRRALPAPADMADYTDRLTYACLLRLASMHADRGRWTDSLVYGQRAHQQRPEDPAPLDRLFRAYRELDRGDDARWCLDQLRRLAPEDPRYALDELDLLRIDHLDDVDRVTAEVDRVLKGTPDGVELRQRAAGVVAQAASFLDAQGQQLAEEVSRLAARVRRAGDKGADQVEIKEAAEFLVARFQRLRRAISSCLPLAYDEGLRDRLRQLGRQLGQHADHCRSLA